MRLPVLPAALISTLSAVAACSPVAPDAPALLPRSEIVARTAGASDQQRGQQAADELAARAAALRARAADLRRRGISNDEYAELLRRARALEEQQG